MKWTNDKLEILKDEYGYVDNKELATKLDCSITALVKKASRMNIKKVTNNSITDGQKYCTYCKSYHNINQFYRDKHANEGYQYYCKLYYKSHNPREPKDYSLDWKKNPIIIIDGKECIKCKICGDTLELDFFYKNKKMINGRVNVCKKCYKKR